MIRARDIMTKDPVTVSPEMEIVQAAKILLERSINGVPVVDNEKLVGILCQSDLISQQRRFPVPSVFTLLDGFIPLSSGKDIEKTVRKMAAAIVSDAMTVDPVTVNPVTEIEEIAGLMIDRNFHTIPVVENEKLIGVIGKEDILKTLIPSSR
ncbi:CBS domain-containing protein [Thermodesulfobacteriota bacterium]